MNKTKATITAKEFENWKAACRKEFAKTPDEPLTNNLINLFLNVLDTDKSQEKRDNADKRLMEFYENELAHAGKLCCEHCGGKMEVYYTVQCFGCVKPTDKNYMMAVKWLERNEPGFDSDSFWDDLCDMEAIQGNDTYMKIPEGKGKYRSNYDLFAKHFDVSVPYFVSW